MRPLVLDYKASFNIARFAGNTTSAILLSIVVLSFWGLVSSSDKGLLSSSIDPYIWTVLRFSLWQALLSALFALAIGLLMARSLLMVSPQMPRWLLKAILNAWGLCFVAPVILVVLAVVSSLGRTSWLQQTLHLEWNIYGLNGILIAHCFLNAPLIARQIYQLYQGIPNRYWQQSEQLGFTGWQRWRIIEWPQLRGSFFSLFCLVFLLCFGSFTIVLALGGGPQSSTLEVAIYQALRYDFDLVFAAQCALLQLLFSLVLGGYLLGREKVIALQATPQFFALQLSKPRAFKHWIMVLISNASLAFIASGSLSSLSQLSWNKIPWHSLLQSSLWSLSIALLSLAWVLIFGLSLLWRHYNLLTQKRQGLSRIQELIASILLLCPAMVVTTGLYCLLLPLTNIEPYTLALVSLVNALMALPFFIRSLKQNLHQVHLDYAKLIQSMELSGLALLTLIIWPRVKHAFALACSLVLVLSLGDMGVIALIGSSEFVTLPLLLYQQLSSYQFALASFTGLLLLVLCALLFWLCETIIVGKTSNAITR